MTIFMAMIASSFGTASAVSALSYAGMVPNSLIKSPNSSTIYWRATNGKRYVFPNEKTYASWYGHDFSRVYTVSDSYLAGLPLAGNVTYKPGTRLVKIQTDPKVYAVSRYGVLRHVTSASVAQSLYGNAWTSQIDDMPDTFFLNYTIGSAIYNTSDYNRDQELGTITNPSDNIRGLEGTGSIGNGAVMLNVTNRNRVSNVEYVTVTANLSGTNAYAPNPNIIIYDENGNQELTRCTWSNSCSYTLNSAYWQSRTLFARAQSWSGGMLESSHINVGYGASDTVFIPSTPTYFYPNNDNVATTYTLNADRTTVSNGNAVNLTYTATPSNPNAQRVEIRDNRTDTLIASFAGTNANAYGTQSVILWARNTWTNDTVTFVAKIFDINNTQIGTAYSPVITINGNASPSYGPLTGTLTAWADRYAANHGETVRLYATVSNTNVPANTVTVSLYNDNGTLLNACNGTVTCTYDLSIYNQSNIAAGYRFHVIARDTRGYELQPLYSSTITINPGIPYQPAAFTGDLTLTPSALGVYQGDALTLTARLDNSTVALSNVTIRIYNAETDELIQQCAGTSVCSATWMAQYYGPYNNAVRFYALATDSQGRTLPYQQYTPAIAVAPAWR